LGRPLELFLDSLGGAGSRDGAGSLNGADSPASGGLEQHADLLELAGDRSRTAEERVRAGVSLVRRLTAGRTALIVFEDLHWADSESIALFEELTAPDAGQLLLVGSYRPDGLTRRHPAAELLPRLERRHTVTHLNLAPLTAGDVGALLAAVYGQAPSYRLVEALHTRTGGNPFFLEELIAVSGDAEPEDLCAQPLPWTVAEAIRGQAADLDPAARRILSAAAVLGRRVPFDLLAAVTATPEERLIPLLRELVDAGLLVETGPDVFGFRQELAREAIEGMLLGRERRRLHEAGLEALRAAGSRDYAAIARHARGAARFDNLVAAARRGAREYLAVGSTYLALSLAEVGLSEVEDDLELRALGAEAAWLAGLTAEAVEHADRWLQLARDAGSAADEAAALSLRGRVAAELGDRELAAAVTDELVATLDKLPTDEQRARAVAAVAQAYMLRCRWEEARQWADKAAALAEADGLAAVRLAALVEKGSALMCDPATEEEGRVLLEAAAADGERLGERVLAARALNNLVWHARQWAPDEVRERLEQMRRHAEAAGFTSLADAGYAEGAATLAGIEGDLDAAIGHLASRRADGRYGGAGPDWLSIIQAGFALEAGDLAAAERYTRDARPATKRTAVAMAGLDLHLALRQGDLLRARRLLAEQLAVADERGWVPPEQVHDLLSAGLRAGLPVGELRPLVARANRGGHRPLAADSPWRRLLDAQVAEAEGRSDQAAAGYAAAAEGLLATDVELAGARGTAHVGAARTLIALGRLAEAREYAERAAEILARWRGWRVEELDAVRRRLGLGGELPGPEALTPREREVVGLLAAGLTNSQLADRLYISPRTAAVHVSNILAKLGMSSRTEVAAWAVREGLALPD